MYGTVVGVLRGGPSREHDVSLKTGHAVVANLPRNRFTVRDIYLDRQGDWYERGKKSAPADILRTIDVVVIALHGEYGEDGEVQKLLERFGIPYTGSDSLGSYMAMHKILAKERAKAAGLRTPKHFYIEPGADIDSVVYHLVRTFQQPLVVKPVRWGSSHGVSIVGGYAPLHRAISKLIIEADGVLIEEYIRGTEATSGVIEKFRGEELYALPSVEIIPPKGDFYSLDAKYSGTSSEISPGRFSKSESDELAESARTMHRALGLRHYSRSDFIVTPRGIYYLETNTLPALSKEAVLPKSLAAVGVSFPDFITHLVDLALTR